MSSSIHSPTLFFETRLLNEPELTSSDTLKITLLTAPSPWILIFTDFSMGIKVQENTDLDLIIFIITDLKCVQP